MAAAKKKENLNDEETNTLRRMVNKLYLIKTGKTEFDVATEEKVLLALNPQIENIKAANYTYPELSFGVNSHAYAYYEPERNQQIDIKKDVLKAVDLDLSEAKVKYANDANIFKTSYELSQNIIHELKGRGFTKEEISSSLYERGIKTGSISKVINNMYSKFEKPVKASSNSKYDCEGHFEKLASELPGLFEKGKNAFNSKKTLQENVELRESVLRQREIKI